MLYNSYVCLHKCYIMDINKQHIVLNLIRSGRYTSNEDGRIVSHCGKEPRVLAGIKHYSGYLQYNLDIGFNETISVYAQVFVYLSTYMETYNPKFVIDHIDKDKANNRHANLRCITEKDNLQGEWREGKRPFKIRVRIPIDQRVKIREEHAAGVSAVKLAEKYKTSRQTIASICAVK